VTRALGVVAVLALGLAAAATMWWLAADAQPVTVDEIGDQNQTLPRAQVPRFALKGDAARLYAFAVDNADTLRWMPCTCGCAGFGHSSNRSCYIKAESGVSVTFTSHAAT
jgi:hypothetical protein